jgi:hypothetical protein
MTDWAQVVRQIIRYKKWGYSDLAAIDRESIEVYPRAIASFIP